MFLFFVSTSLSIYSSCNQDRIVLVSSSVIVNCLFQGFFNSVGSGSVFYVKTNDVSMNLSDCVFYNCSSYVSGGCIHYESTSNGSIFVNRVCCGSCFVTKTYTGIELGHALFISGNQITYISLLSLSNCAPRTTQAISPIHLFGSDQTITDLNSSYNLAKAYSGLSTISASNLSCSYTTIANCISSSHCSLYMSGGSNQRVLSRINVINCQTSSNGIVICQANSYYTIQESVFSGNNYVLFLVIWYSNYGGSCTLDLKSCFIAHTSTTYSIAGTAQLIKSNNLHTYQIPIVISNFHSRYCDEVLQIDGTFSSRRIQFKSIILLYFLL